MNALGDDVQAARTRFAAWLRWYRAMYPEEAGSQNELARKLGLAGPTLTYLLEDGSTRTPSFRTIMAARRLLRMSVDALLFTDPPAVPKR